MFVFKKIVGVLIMPLPIALFLLAAGLLFRAVGRRRGGSVALFCSACVVLVSSCAPVSTALLHPLESSYSSIADASSLEPVPRYVAVLGSAYKPDDGLTVTAALEGVAVVRVAEAVRLFRQLPAATLLVSGGARSGNEPSAHGYALAAKELGVPEESILALDTPLDTASEIRAIRDLLAGEPVVLVTSAAHMRRAMELADRVGLRAIAAPTGNLTRSQTGFHLSHLLPSGASLRKTEIALHEYLGLLALRLGVS